MSRSKGFVGSVYSVCVCNHLLHSCLSKTLYCRPYCGYLFISLYVSQQVGMNCSSVLYRDGWSITLISNEPQYEPLSVVVSN